MFIDMDTTPGIFPSRSARLGNPVVVDISTVSASYILLR